MTYAIVVMLLVSLAHPTMASRDYGFERKPIVEACELTELQRAVLDHKWNSLSLKFFSASMERNADPRYIKRVRAEVDRALADLRKEYGTDCVLDIL